MPWMMRRAAPWGAVALALACVACGSGAASDETFGSDTGADTGSGMGEPGAPCQESSECGGGGACRPPAFFPDGDGACGPQCTVDADCGALLDASYALDVALASPAGDGNNVWNSAVLTRGAVCTGGFCQYQCPAYGALVHDDAGAVAGCACLPHFTFDPATSACSWSEDVACSVLERKDRPNPCNACNSDPLFETCNSGRFQCLLNNNHLEGECVEWIQDGAVDACAMGTLGYDCDPACYANCADDECTIDFCNVDIDACIASCCAETDTPMPPDDCMPGGEVEDTPGTCSDSVDNDGDGFTDCDAANPDTDCCGVGACGCGGACTGQGLCGGGATENNAALCTDQMDNDGDGFIDCDANFPDTQCCGVGTCACTGACEGHGICM